MTAADVCSYLRGRLQMRVTALDDGRYALAPLPRDVGNGKWEPEVWDLKELCEQYKIPLDRVGLQGDGRSLGPVAPEPAPAVVHLPPCIADQRPCLELDEVAGGVFCTREAGHLEDHAAHDSTGAVVRQWPRKTPP